MSGIAGIFYRDGRPVQRPVLARVVEVIAHRGPNGSGLWCQGPVGLGHCMLWTTPESLQEAMPLIARGGELIITADARIDNRDELIRQLRLDEQPAAGIGDGELILAAYEKWGEHCPEHLLGAFAFAIWDKRRQQLFCARDQFGVKPFYYYLSERLFAFATEIKALLPLEDIPQRLEELRIARHLVPLDIDPALTLYADILRLLPAQCLAVSEHQVKKDRYWELDPSREMRLGSDEAYTEAFRELFFEAVRCRLRATSGIGSMLSGGLDSSSITSVGGDLLAQADAAPLPTFSAVFDKVKESDERVYIEAVLAQGPFESHYFHADHFGPLAELAPMLWHQDGLFESGNLYLTWGICKLAQQRGVRVLLDGFDGDRVVPLGICHLWAFANNRRWLVLARHLRALEKVMGEPSWLTTLWGYMRREYPRLSMVQRQAKRIRRLASRKRAHVKALSRPSRSSGFIEKSFVERMRLSERRPLYPSFESGRAAHHWMLTGPIIAEELEELDKAGSAFGLEIRYPFFDRRLVEFCLALPPEQQLRDGWTRMILRRAMQGILPPQVQWRPKKGDVVPAFDYGLLANSRELIEDVVLGADGALWAYVDREALQDIYRRLDSAGAYAEDGGALWKAVTLACWLHDWERNRSVSPVTGR